jgi:hypothetical protein
VASAAYQSALRLARLVLAGWDPAKHPRHPKGSPGGGRFAPKAGGGGATPAEKVVATKVAAKAKPGINKVGRAALAKARQLAKEQAKAAEAKAAKVPKAKPKAKAAAGDGGEGFKARLPLTTAKAAAADGYAPTGVRFATRAEAEADAASSLGYQRGTAEYAVTKGRGDKPWGLVVRNTRGPSDLSGKPGTGRIDPAKWAEPVSVASPVSARFVAEVEAAMSGVPDAVRRRVAGNGLAVRLADKVTDARPDLAEVSPRGWAEGGTWDNAEGLYDRSAGMVVSTERKRLAGLGSAYVRSDRAGGVTLHEYGHGVDANWNAPGGGLAGIFGGDDRLSRTTAFRDAYEADVRGLSAVPAAPGDQRSLKYFLQPGDSGPSEAFAEGFAVSHGRRGAFGYPETFRRSFPKTIAFIQAKMATA